ncbi:MAG: SPFH domain-containing protein [Promethearchaeota archaeon]
MEINLDITFYVLVALFLVFLFFVFLVSRYNKFKTNQYVIHLRNGKIKNAGLGGSIIKLPLIDEIIVIPTTTRKTLLDAHEKVLSREYQDLKIVAFLFWRVSDPKQAFNAVVWNPRSPDYVENILKNASEAIIRTTCASLELETIIRERTQIIKIITDQLHNLTKDWGIIIESLEIIEVEVIDKGLKQNMEAVKKISEEQKARLAKANALEIYRLRELEVQKKVGVAEQETNQEVMIKRKNLEIAQQDLERKRKLIEAEAQKQYNIKIAEGEAQRVKMVNLAELEAKAEGMKAQMLAKAEGLRKQVEALNQADERLIATKLLEVMPEIFKNIKPDKMLMMGNGSDTFQNIASVFLPFLEILPQFSDTVKKLIGTKTSYTQTRAINEKMRDLFVPSSDEDLINEKATSSAKKSTKSKKK